MWLTPIYCHSLAQVVFRKNRSGYLSPGACPSKTFIKLGVKGHLLAGLGWYSDGLVYLPTYLTLSPWLSMHVSSSKPMVHLPQGFYKQCPLLFFSPLIAWLVAFSPSLSWAVLSQGSIVQLGQASLLHSVDVSMVALSHRWPRSLAVDLVVSCFPLLWYELWEGAEWPHLCCSW